MAWVIDLRHYMDEAKASIPESVQGKMSLPFTIPPSILVCKKERKPFTLRQSSWLKKRVQLQDCRSSGTEVVAAAMLLEHQIH